MALDDLWNAITVEDIIEVGRGLEHICDGVVLIAEGVEIIADVVINVAERI